MIPSSFSLRTKVLSGIGFMLLLFLFVILFYLFRMREIGEMLRVVNTGYFPLARVAGQMESLPPRMEIDAERLIAIHEKRGQAISLYRNLDIFFTRLMREKIGKAAEITVKTLGMVRTEEERTNDG